MSHTRFHRAHQAQLKRAAAVLFSTPTRAPLPVSIDWVDLPQPRSRMALAADTRAAAVASLLRITPTRTFSAVLVWLRASERISVSVLGIQTGNVISGMVRRTRLPMCNWDELQYPGAHEHPSHTAIATRPTSEGEIRYAVMPASCCL